MREVHMITILGTANEFLSDGSIGQTRFYLITSWTIRLAEWKFKLRLNNQYKRYQYSVIRFDIAPYIIHTDHKWLSNVINGLNHNDMIEIDDDVYDIVMNTMQQNMKDECNHKPI